MAETPLLEALQVEKLFFRLLDDNRVDDVCDLLADDIRWHRPGGWIEGKEASRASMEGRDPNLVIRHLVMNDVATWVSDDVIRIDYCVVSYSSNDPNQGPNPPTPVPTVADCRDELRVADGKFLFISRDPSPVFLRPGLDNKYVESADSSA